MADEELEKLKAQLLEKGVTAPKSWKVARCKKELAKLNSTDTEQAASAGEKSTDTEQAASAGEKSTDTEQASSADESGGDLDESANDAEDLDGTVWVKAKVDFSNERLNLDRIQRGEKLSVSSQQAEFLVTIDRTCEYLND